MPLAYLVNQYPKVSHTFIRREIRGLEARGERILRFSIRRSQDRSLDGEDLEEEARTEYCLDGGVAPLLLATARVAVTRPARLLDALGVAVRMGRRSPRGILRHLAYLAEACHLLGRMQAGGADHVHAHFGTNAATVALLLHRLGGPPYSLTVHGAEEFDAPEALSLGRKIEESSFVIGISSFGASQLRRWIPTSAYDKVHVVRCAVDEAFLREVSPVPETSRTLLCVARLSAEKCPLDLVSAVATLRDEGCDAQLVFAGDGDLREAVEGRARRLGVEDAVEVTGFLTSAQVRSRIRDARCVVLPSVAEGLPVVLMEALAMGRPVVATWVAGVPELVRPGENGWLVPPGDPPALVAALREALESSSQRLSAMGKAGHERVRRVHHLETEVAELAALFARHRPDRPGDAAR